jgi:drug/metabolite transporter (DMT)-like permease
MAPPGQNRQSYVVSAVALAYVVLWSTAFIAVKFGVRYSPPLTLLAIRFMLAGGLLAVLARWMGQPWPQNRKGWIRLTVIGMLNQGAPSAMIFIALRHSSAGMASIIMVTNPLIVALLAPKLLGEPLTRSKVVGLAIGLAGVGTVMANRIGAGGKTDTPMGIALMVGAVLCMVAATVVFKKYPPREPLLMVNVVQQLVSGLMMIPIAVIAENPLKLVPTLTFFGAVAHLVLMISITASLMWFWILGKGQASSAGAYLFLSPIFGLAFASVILNERFGVREVIGLVLVIAGVVFIRRTPRPAVPAPKLGT